MSCLVSGCSYGMKYSIQLRTDRFFKLVRQLVTDWINAAGKCLVDTLRSLVICCLYQLPLSISLRDRICNCISEQ